MTQKEKQLLLKDLCARLLHGVMVQPIGLVAPHMLVGYDKGLVRIDTEQRYSLEDIKPYLRPMSSMTSKEWVEFCDCSLKDEMSWVITRNRQKLIPVQNREDYLNSKHFDYRGLIERGLALEAPDGMYK